MRNPLKTSAIMRSRWTALWSLIAVVAPMTAQNAASVKQDATQNVYSTVVDYLRPDLYLCIGQSNMAGRGKLTEAMLDTLQDVYLWNDQQQFEAAANPLNRYSTIRKSLNMQGVGPSYSFARTMQAATQRPIGLVVNARGGSSKGLQPLINESDPHFSAESQLILGERYAKALLSLPALDK